MQATHPIRAYRERQQPPISQGELGERIGVTRFTVGRWEDGGRPDKDLLAKITEVTGVSARELRPDLAELMSAGAEASA